MTYFQFYFYWTCFLPIILFLSAFSSLSKSKQKELSLSLHKGELLIDLVFYDFISAILDLDICRMSTLEAADNILVIDGGQIVEVKFHLQSQLI